MSGGSVVPTNPLVMPAAEVRDDPPNPASWGLVVRVASTVPEPGMTAWDTAQLAVNNAAVQVPALLPGRRCVSFRAVCAAGQEIFLGKANTVTTLTGTGLKDRETLSMNLEAASEIWAIATAAGQRLYIAEVVFTP